MEDIAQRLSAVLARKRQVPPSLQGPGPELYAKAAGALWQEWMHNPARLIEHQVGWWGKTLAHYAEAQAALASGLFTAPEDPGPKDRRFSNPLWDSHPWFNFAKKQFLLNAQAVSEAVQGMDHLDPRERKRLDYFTRQIVEMMNPANFLATNPDALERAVATEGQSLIDGLENLVADLERNDGEMVVTLADPTAFTVGVNIATTPGAVVWRNHLFELIQYAPATDQVQSVPIVIFPPWINKFYVLDLTARNSLIKWLVDQGQTVFVVSWVNPSPALRDISLSDYIDQGYVPALREAAAICGVPRVNAVGYCIAGTTLALALAVMAGRGEDLVASATFFTTLTDFSDQGEVGVFLDDDFLDGIEAEALRTGILDRFYMARTFSFLRASDLIWQPAIRSYMLGERPPAFDLLYWNGDGTNLPARMAVDYLRGLCQQNRFAGGEGFEVCGQRVHLSQVTLPLCAIACETDHIAGWRSSYKGVQTMGSPDKTFILSESGHIAGIVNPPSRNKYGHWTNPDLTLPPEAWQAQAARSEGSWWPRWIGWLSRFSGGAVPARTPGDSGHPVLAPAPGTYVTASPES